MGMVNTVYRAHVPWVSGLSRIGSRNLVFEVRWILFGSTFESPVYKLRPSYAECYRRVFQLYSHSQLTQTAMYFVSVSVSL